MEELRSTEILDKEIQADARKKAERILSSSDAECQSVLDDVANRVSAATKERTDAYNRKAEQFAHDADAALPLEKKRYLVSFTGKTVSDAINTYLTGLSDERRFKLIEKQFNRCKSIIAGRKINAEVYGCSVKQAETFLKKELGKDLGSVKETVFEKTGQDSIEGISLHEGVILEAEDHSIRCRLTIEELVSEIKDTYSRELVDTLFGGRLTND